MSPLLAPLFAQLLSLQLADRSEARYVKQSEGRFEGYTAPSAALRLTDPRTTVALIYAPSLSLVPLDRAPRELYVFHFVSAAASYRLSKKTSLSLTSSLGIGSLNFRVVSLQGQPVANGTDVATGNPTTGNPTTGNPTTGNPTAGNPTAGNPTTGNPTTGAVNAGGVTRPDISDQKVRYYTFSNSLGLVHQIQKAWSVTALAGATSASGRDDESRKVYPLLRGWLVGGATTYTYPLNARDSLASNLGLIKAWSSQGTEVATTNATETWFHRFALRTAGSLSAGLNVTRFSQPDGLRGLSVFPTFSLGISHTARLGRGQFSVSANAFSTPALDPLRALVDPRVGAGSNVGYTRDKLGLFASGSASFSVAPVDHDEGAVNAYSGEVRASYQLAALTLVDVGARVIRQTYQKNEVIPISWIASVGLSFGYDIRLTGRRKH